MDQIMCASIFPHPLLVSSGPVAHLHIQAESGAYFYGIFLPISAAESIYSFITAVRHRVSPEFIKSRNCVPMTFISESPPPAQGQ